MGISSFMRCVWIALLAFLLAVPSVRAEDRSPDENQHRSFGEWIMRCQSLASAKPTPRQDSKSVCFLFQHVVSESDPAITLLVMILPSRDGGHKLRVLAPLGILLSSGVRVKVDSTVVGQTEFSRCFPEGCFSEVILDPPLTERLKKGRNSFFIVFPEESQGVGFPISLKGLTAGLQNLP